MTDSKLTKGEKTVMAFLASVAPVGAIALDNRIRAWVPKADGRVAYHGCRGANARSLYRLVRRGLVRMEASPITFRHTFHLTGTDR